MAGLYELFQQLGRYHAINGIRFLPEPQRTEELEKILKVRVAMGWFNGALHVAKTLDRALTTEELEKILEVRVAMGDLKVAFRVADFILGPH